MKAETEKECARKIEAANRKVADILAEGEKRYANLNERYKKDYQKLLVIAEKEYEILETIKPRHHYSNVSQLLTAYLSVDLNDDDHKERIFDLFAQRADYVNELLLEALNAPRFDRFASYLFECQCIVNCLKEHLSVFSRSPNGFECFENIMMNFLRFCRYINQIDEEWENEDTEFCCFSRIQSIFEDAICIYSAGNQRKKVIEMGDELVCVMRYEYERFESQIVPVGESS